MERTFQLERGRIDMETGQFPVTLFTNGEASDGHIVDIRGLEVAEMVPMFRNHIADPAERLGSLTNGHKAGKTTRLGGASLKMTGRLDLEGDSAAADIRRDIAQGISVGDITGMSGRWDPISEPVARSALSETHYAYQKDLGGFYTPMFFERSRVLEGSVVGIPADSAALIGRAQDTGRPSHVRDFYRDLIDGVIYVPQAPEPDLEALSQLREEIEAEVRAELEEEYEELQSERGGGEMLPKPVAEYIQNAVYRLALLKEDAANDSTSEEGSPEGVRAEPEKPGEPAGFVPVTVTRHDWTSFDDKAKAIIEEKLGIPT